MPRASEKAAHDDELGLGIPRGPFVGMWKAATYRDVCIRLVSTASKKKTKQSGQQGASGEVYKEIHAHKMVLQAGSTYFRGLLTTGQDMAAQPSRDQPEREIKRSKRKQDETEQAANENSQTVDMSCNSKEEADAIESVLCFLYTHDVPDSPTINMLSKMITAADYLGADLCVKACAISFSKLAIHMNDLPLVYDVLDVFKRCSACNTAVMEVVQDALSEQMLATYGNVPDIVTNGDLLLSFCSLPLDAVAAWGRSDGLEVDSEDSVVVVLNKWWQSQAKHIQTEDCKKQLSALVRPAHLSNGFLLHVLDALDWFIAPFPSYKHVCSVCHLSGQHNISTDTKPGSKLNLEPRGFIDEHRELQLEWLVNVDQILQAAKCKEGRTIHGPSGYRAGHTWSVFLDVSTADGRSSNRDDHMDIEETSDDDANSDSGSDSSSDSDNDNHGSHNVKGRCVKLKLGVKKEVAGGIQVDDVPATAGVYVAGDPFYLDWENYVFEGNRARFKSVYIKSKDLASRLRRHAIRNQLVLDATITTEDYEDKRQPRDSW